MSQPVQPTSGKYQHPLEGPLHSCPHCGKILNQHFAPGAQPGGNSIPANGISGNFADNEGIIHLFGDNGPHFEGQQQEVEPERPAVETPPATPVDPALVASGDVFVSAPPQMIRRTEHHVSGQARPEKALGHTIPGMTPKEAPAPAAPPVVHTQADALNILDHPTIGGKVTIVVCCYGEEHENLHRRCLNSIVRTVPPSRMDLRIIANQVGTASNNYFNSLPVTKVYPDYKNRRKYPAMRQVFYDQANPIDTNYIVWYDDDSYAKVEAWLSILGEVIVAQNPVERVGMYGHVMYHPLKHPDPKKDPRLWFRNGSWWKNQNFRNRQGRAVPNGDKIHFCVGGFWAISTECMRIAQVPDARLNHNGGDICIGEQIHQSGFKMKTFNENKQFIHTSAAPRRGFREKFPWYR